jgi:2-dehydro-3-deoxyphosphogluconate aldolase / (4S)-4-hydroxy-2-oxoglutarate aldolase
MSDADHEIADLLAICPVIPVYTPGSVDEAVAVARALLRGGLRVIEITLRNSIALSALRAIVTQVPDAIVAAGTVLSVQQLAEARYAGAAFAVSPGLTPTLLAAARGSGALLLPGASTAGELMAGLEAGYRHFKFFPAAAAGGVAMLKALFGPFPQVRFCPTGGIGAQSASEYLNLPNVVCIGGSWLTPKAAVAAGDWQAIESLARAAASLRSVGDHAQPQ